MRVAGIKAALRIQQADYWPALNGSATYSTARKGNIPPLRGADGIPSSPGGSRSQDYPRQGVSVTSVDRSRLEWVP